MILFPLCLYILLSFSFIGFFKLYQSEEKNLKIHDWLNILILTFFYCFNTYIVAAATGGVLWSLGFVLAYSLLPLLVYYINKFIKNNSLSLRDAVILSLIIFASSFCITLFATIVLILPIYIFIKLSFKKILQLDYKKIGFIFITLILLFSYFIVPYILELSFGSSGATATNLINSTAGLQQKGVLSMFLFYFTWVIYTPWGPRSVFTFYKYLLSPFYMATVLSLYVVIVSYFLRKKSIIKEVIPYIILLLLGMLIGKGPQEPFGFVWSSLVNFNTIFTVFRSPDSKFGIIILFSLTAIFLHIFKNYRKSIPLKIYLLIATVIIALPLFTGEAVLGKKVTGESGYFITSISPEYSSALKILNSDSSLANVVSYPEPGYGPFIEEGGNIFIGQDKLEMLSKQPFIHSNIAGNVEFNNLTKKIYENFDFSSDSELNIKYFILNKNIMNQDENNLDNFRKNLLKQFQVKKLIDNNVLELYLDEDKSFIPKISLKNNKAKINFKYINPTKYLITIDDLNEPDELVFLESFNKNWQLYSTDDLSSYNKGSFLSDWQFLFKKPIFNSQHREIYNYANSWVLNPVDNKNQLSLILYYKSQSYIYVGLFITLITLISCLFYIILSTLKNLKNKEKITSPR
jgi:hypothetical protein